MISGVEGLDDAVRNDPNLHRVGTAKVFNARHSVLPKRGCRSVQIDELVMIAAQSYRSQVPRLRER